MSRRAARSCADALEASGLAIAVAILAVPLSCFHFTLFLIPARLARPWVRTLHAAALLLSIPVSVPLLALELPRLGSATFGAPYRTGVLLTLVDLIRRPIGAATPERSAGLASAERCSRSNDVPAGQAA